MCVVAGGLEEKIRCKELQTLTTSTRGINTQKLQFWICLKRVCDGFFLLGRACTNTKDGTQKTQIEEGKSARARESLGKLGVY